MIASDPRLDILHREVEENAILTIARRQPLAVDLRETISAIRIAGDVERIGDLAKNIAKRAVAIGDDFHHALASSDHTALRVHIETDNHASHRRPDFHTLNLLARREELRRQLVQAGFDVAQPLGALLLRGGDRGVKRAAAALRLRQRPLQRAHACQRHEFLFR